MKPLAAILGVLVLAAAAIQPDPARAQQPTVSRSPAAAPVLGRVAPGAGATTFSVSTSGVVTRTSGDAIRITSGSITTPTITITCGLLNLNSLCALRPIRVSVQASGATGGARITSLRAGAMSGSAYRAGAVRQGPVLTFDIDPIGLLGSASFPLGMDIQLDAGAQPGDQTFNYTVTAHFL